MSRDDPPDYLERFPMLDIANRGWMPQREIVWRNQLREEIGRAWTELAEFRLLVVYKLKDPDSSADIKGSQSVSLIPKYHGTVTQKPYGLCLGCTCHVGRLFYRNADWFCANCQGLRHRSSFITPAERRTEELDSLRDLNRGRPLGMRESVYQAKLARRAQLKADLEFTYKRPSHRFLYSVHAEWLSSE